VEFLKLCFAQKRKTLANNLKALHGDDAVRRALGAAGIRRDARAEALTLEQTAAVFRAL
jgi:16S rRNA A1518/A1519 N6-dimethyltransferase RsmA/KsgA/DIM1 with predicted DNA glycosylase/AP lyase activity